MRPYIQILVIRNKNDTASIKRVQYLDLSQADYKMGHVHYFRNTFVLTIVNIMTNPSNFFKFQILIISRRQSSGPFVLTKY